MSFLEVAVIAGAAGVFVALLAVALLRRRRGTPDRSGDAVAAAVNARQALLDEREERLNLQFRQQRDAQATHDQRETALHARESALLAAEAALSDERERLAGLTAEQARDEVIAEVVDAARVSASQTAAAIVARAEAEAEDRARELVVTAMGRIAAEQTNDSAVAVVALPSEDLKGRLIGKEGRNIRSFEQVTGANLIVDDTPGSVLVSCFDPLRREVARRTLVELVADGRVHPGRIEDTFERVQAKTSQFTREAGQAAVAEMGITDLPIELVDVLGALQYRTSFGQTVLAHLVECGHLAAAMAAELGLDVAVCRRAAFLHDLGKAVVLDGGSHAAAGAELAQRHGEHPDVVHAIAAHHNEVEPQSLEAVITQVADAISASRPGARRDSLESYVQRVTTIERLAAAHPGVERAYAVQSGREVRVMVAPESIDDQQAAALAQELARQIETKLTYSGQIKITVVRESRATAVAR